MSETKSKQYLGKNNPFFGKNHSEETKEKIRQAKLGKKLSKEHRDKIAKSNKSHLRKKQVAQYGMNGDFITIHKSVGDAANSVGVSQASLSHALIGNSKSSGGFKWKYYEK